jgi:NAD(P)-dependent dehydrogenase (short-subunit alcohol dehydrogenase family)
VIGLARSLATAGRDHGIKVNLIAPAAYTRMAGGPDSEKDSPRDAVLASQMSPDLVAPMVVFLAHEDCPVSGEIYAAGAGRFSRIFIASTEGYVLPAPTVEDIADNWAAINDESGYYVPADLIGWSEAFTAHLAQ